MHHHDQNKTSEHSVYVIIEGVSVWKGTRLVYNLGNGGFPVHRDPVHRIFPKPRKMTVGALPAPTPAGLQGWRQVPDPTMTEHGNTVCVPGRPFTIIVQVSNGSKVKVGLILIYRLAISKR